MNELDPAGARLCVRPMSEFQSNEAYRELHADLLTRLKDDEDLRAVCQDLVRRFLSTKVGPRQGGDGYSRAGAWTTFAPRPRYSSTHLRFSECRRR